MKTDFNTLCDLASYSLNVLKEAELIKFNVEQDRIPLIEAMATEYGVGLATDDDIKDQAIEEVEDKMGKDHLPEDLTESEIFNHARKEIIKAFSGENIGGLYLVESLHNLAKRITKFLLESPLVEDVYSSDEDLVLFLVAKIRNFSIRKN